MKEPKLTTGENRTIRADLFTDGIYSVSFKLGNEFGISKSESTASLCLISNGPIFYETSDGMNILVVKEGGRMPYFTQVETWGDNAFLDNELKAVIDLRINGIYGPEFNSKKINDGRGNFGVDFFMSITPQYYVYYNKQNAQEEIKKRLEKIKGNAPSWNFDNLFNSIKNQKYNELPQENSYKQFSFDNYKEISKDNKLLASISEAIKSDYSPGVKILMVKDIIKRYDKN